MLAMVKRISVFDSRANCGLA